MEFTRILSSFHGALLSADNVHSFATIFSKGDSNKVSYIVCHLRKFLIEEKYMDMYKLLDDQKLHTRKFFLFIILNGEFPILEAMLALVPLEPLIWCIPTLGEYLMCEIIWGLEMGEFIYELIPSGWPQLGIEVAEAFLGHFKHFEPTNCLDKLQRLCVACYTLLCRLTAYDYGNEIENMIKSISEIIQNFLKYYTDLPNAHKLDALGTNDLYKFKANRFKNILNLVLECFNMFTSKISFLDDHPLYNLTFMNSNFKTPTCNVCDSSKTEVLQSLKNVNAFLLEIFQFIVMDISVDTFCAWSEFEEDGKNVQQTIGELCNKVHVKLQNISTVAEHTVLVMLPLMARKPTDIKELVCTVDTNTILEKINSNSEESVLWIRALANKDDLIQFNELLDVVYAKINVFDEKESLALFYKIKNSARFNRERQDFLIALTIKLFAKCNIDEKHKILKDRFKDKEFFDAEKPNENDFEIMSNSIFNKIIADVNSDFSDVLTVFYQRPRSVYVKIFSLASQAQLINPMLKVMELLKDYADYYYTQDTLPCVVGFVPYIVKCTMTNNDYRNIIKFISEMIKNKIICETQVLILVIMPGIHEALVHKHIPLLYALTRLLIAAYPVRKLASYKAPMIVNIAQILRVVRMADVSIKDFQLEGLYVVEIVLKFLDNIISTYKNQFSDAETNWLVHKLSNMNLSPINFHYFNFFWKQTHVRLFESATGMPVRIDCSPDLLASKLRQMLPWCTLDEWCEFWDNFIAESIKSTDALRAFNTAMYSIVSVINMFHTDKTRIALFNCYKNFIHIIRYKYFEEPLRSSRVKLCMSLLAHNLDITKDRDVIEIETRVLPLFSYLSEQKINYKRDVLSYFMNNRYITAVLEYEATEGRQ